MEVFTQSIGQCASHFYLTSNQNTIGQLTLDWSYDSFYFKYKNEPWIVLSYGTRGNKHEPEKFDSEEKKFVFSQLKNYAFSVMHNKDNKDNKDAIIAIQHLQKMIV